MNTGRLKYEGVNFITVCHVFNLYRLHDHRPHSFLKIDKVAKQEQKVHEIIFKWTSGEWQVSEQMCKVNYIRPRLHTGIISDYVVLADVCLP